jgi:hypothetical protein
MLAGFLLAQHALSVSADEPAKEIKFKKTQLDDKFRSEGVSIGDFNYDGKLDISAGSVFYAAGEWKLTPVLEKPKEFDPHGYSDSFCNFADDVNGDGRTDLIVVGFPGKETFWFEQPKEAGGEWKRHLVTPITNNESPDMRDVDGDRKRELLLGYDPGGHLGYAKRTAEVDNPWKLISVSAPSAPGTGKFSHGIGAGDINGDGRIDILVKDGWWEAPADKSAETSETPWVFHPAKLGENCAQMYVYDFDGDGDADVLSSSAHGIGIWWHEQTPEGWKTHDIDKSFSQTHSLCLADINGDKLPDFVTGKRWWAHGPKGDVQADQPAVLFWYELTRKDGQPIWIPHQIDHDSGVGTQFEVGDVNGDGLLDIAIANKKGAFYFEQQRP